MNLTAALQSAFDKIAEALGAPAPTLPWPPSQTSLPAVSSHKKTLENLFSILVPSNGLDGSELFRATTEVALRPELHNGRHWALIGLLQLRQSLRDCVPAAMSQTQTLVKQVTRGPLLNATLKRALDVAAQFKAVVESGQAVPLQDFAELRDKYAEAVAAVAAMSKDELFDAVKMGDVQALLVRTTSSIFDLLGYVFVLGQLEGMCHEIVADIPNFDVVAATNLYAAYQRRVNMAANEHFKMGKHTFNTSDLRCTGASSSSSSPSTTRCPNPRLTIGPFAHQCHACAISTCTRIATGLRKSDAEKQAMVVELATTMPLASYAQLAELARSLSPSFM